MHEPGATCRIRPPSQRPAPCLRHQAGLATALLLHLLLGACEGSLAGDRFPVDSEPRAATVWVDGRQRGVTELEVPVRYFGEHLVELEHPPYLPGRQYFVPERQLHDIDPPASPWLFPFDFVFEIVQRLRGWEAPGVEAKLPSQPLTEPAPELRTEEAIRAADAAARERQ